MKEFASRVQSLTLNDAHEEEIFLITNYIDNQVKYRRH